MVVNFRFVSTGCGVSCGVVGAGVMPSSGPALPQQYGVPSVVTAQVTVRPAEMARNALAGGANAVTVTVELAVLALPAASVAVQVTTVVPIGYGAGPPEWSQFTTGVLTMSTADTGGSVTEAPDALVAAMVIGANRVSTGGVVSTTCTKDEPVAESPAALLARQFTVVVPSANVPAPMAGVQLTVAPASLVVGAGTVTVAPPGPGASAVIGANIVRVSADGNGSTVTDDVAVVRLPDVSTAVQVTGVVPTGKLPGPFEGAQVTVGVPAVSVAVTAGTVTVAPLALVAATVIGANMFSTGGPVSTTFTLDVPVATSPAALVARHWNVVSPIAYTAVLVAGVQLTVALASLVVGAGTATLAPAGLVTSAVMGANIVIASGSGPPPPQPASASATTAAACPMATQRRSRTALGWPTGQRLPRRAASIITASTPWLLKARTLIGPRLNPKTVLPASKRTWSDALGRLQLATQTAMQRMARQARAESTTARAQAQSATAVRARERRTRTARRRRSARPPSTPPIA